MTSEKQDKEETEIDSNELQLLSAMSIEDTPPVPKDYVAHAGEPLPAGTKTFATREEIIEALKTVSDPEIMINIWDLGLVYKIEQKENGNVFIEMTVTAPTCPVAGILPQQAADAVSKLTGVGSVEVKIVWEPAWSLANLSDEARAMIELF